MAMEELAERMGEIRAFCCKWRIRELAVFGSAVRKELRSDSDIDLLVDFEEAAEWDLVDLDVMREEMKAILGRKVDLVERAGILQNANWIFRKEILGSAERIYAAP